MAPLSNAKHTARPHARTTHRYGIPPNCRACPTGCRCPGGERCHTEPGYFLDGVTLGDDDGPLMCHPDPLYALERCSGYSSKIDTTECRPGCVLTISL